MHKVLLDLPGGKKRRVYKQWKQEWDMWEDYKDAQAATDWVRKAKVQRELNLAREIKGNVNDFFRYL